MVVCNAIVPMVFFFRNARRSLPWLMGISILINVGMWYERYVIMITQSRDFIPYAWGDYFPTINEAMIMIGSFCWFFMWFWLFIRFLPTVSLVEVKEQLPAPRKGAGHAAQ
jgi:molybdopterin-containing oxidoreductase family membrane subunit